MSVVVSMAMTVPWAVAVAVRVGMRVRVAGSGANSSFLLQLFDASRVDGPRVSTGGLDTGVRQQFDYGLEILLGPLW